ncbi:MAG: restriction endonuclease subunit S [Candidatus Competibacteraceae bacterium]
MVFIASEETYREWTRRAEPLPGDLILAREAPAGNVVVIGRRGEMGRCALVTAVEDGWLCGTGSFFIKPSERYDSGYLVRLLRSDSCKQKLEKIAGGAVMPNLSNTDLGNLVIDLPPLERQKAIVEEIEAIAEETQRLASLYQQKLTALDDLKKSLLHQAFSGKL